MRKFIVHTLLLFLCTTSLQVVLAQEPYYHQVDFKYFDRHEKEIDALAKNSFVKAYFRYKALEQELEKKLSRNTSFEVSQLISEYKERVQEKRDKLYKRASFLNKFRMKHPKLLVASLVSIIPLILVAEKLHSHFKPTNKDPKKDYKDDKKRDEQRVKEFDRYGLIYNRKFIHKLLQDNHELLDEKFKELITKPREVSEEKPKQTKDYLSDKKFYYKHYQTLITRSSTPKRELINNIARIYLLSTSRLKSVTRTLRGTYHHHTFVVKNPELIKLFDNIAGKISMNDVTQRLAQFSHDFARGDFSATLLMHLTVLKAMREELPEHVQRIDDLISKIRPRLSAFVNHRYDQQVDCELIEHFYPVDEVRTKITKSVSPENKEEVYTTLLELYDKFYNSLDLREELDLAIRHGIGLYSLSQYKDLVNTNLDDLEFTQALLGLPDYKSIKRFLKLGENNEPIQIQDLLIFDAVEFIPAQP